MIEKSEIAEKVINAISRQLNVDRSCVEMRMDEKWLGLVADSLDQVAMILELEEELSIALSGGDVEKMTTPNNAIKFLYEYFQKEEITMQNWLHPAW